MRHPALRLLLATAAALGACRRASPPPPGPLAAASSSAPSSPVPRYLPPPAWSGGVVALAPDGASLYVADEDHLALRTVKLPVDVSTTRSLELPGRPAAVLPTSTDVLVTIRDPGMLLALRRDGDELREVARVPLPGDAWGVALTPDQRRAVVTSAWTHTVSIVDLSEWRVVASLDVAREPRGVVVEPGGEVAWVSHLVGAELTRVDGVAGGAPTASRVSLPPSPMRAPAGGTLSASLGYSLALSPDGARLFAPRHALGAIGTRAWYGAPTVDVLDLERGRPLVPPKRLGLRSARPGDPFVQELRAQHGAVPYVDTTAIVQPRAIVARASTRTLLVLSEGADALVELDAESPDPAVRPVHTWTLGRGRDVPHAVHDVCAAPAGLALSSDESTAYVFCRASYDLAIVGLSSGSFASLRLGDDPLGKKAERGRRIFHSIGDDATSGGLACSGCHPEGRDDGHTWHEVASPVSNEPIFVAEAHALGVGKAAGFARQTPILVGRLDASGPYGWHAQRATLQARVQEGFKLHRWDGGWGDEDTPTSRQRAQALAPFLRAGLVPPPREQRAPSAEEERGRQLFVDARTGCDGCHPLSKGTTDRTAHPLSPLPTRPGFSDEEDVAWKTPGLSFVGGTPPYLHDGSAPTLEALLDANHDRMGRTSHLGRAERAALVAFLRTL